MGLPEILAAARERLNISQEHVAKAAGWDRGQVSKFENRKVGASVAKIDAYITALGVTLVAVPPAASEAQLVALAEEHRALLRRLIELMPTLSADRIGTIRGLVELWESQSGTASAIDQDNRASAS